MADNLEFDEYDHSHRARARRIVVGAFEPRFQFDRFGSFAFGACMGIVKTVCPFCAENEREATCRWPRVVFLKIQCMHWGVTIDFAAGRRVFTVFE